MPQGKVKKISEKGYGFIKPNTGGADLFFHASGVDEPTFDEINEGDSVEYEVGYGRDEKARAEQIRKV